MLSVAKVHPTNFSHSLSFLLKIWEKLMSFEKTYCNESRKQLSQKILLKVSLFQFHFVFAV